MKRIYIIAGVAAVAVVIGIFAFGFAKKDNGEIGLYPEEPVASIFILSPAFGDQFELGLPVVIEAFANAAQPVAAIELWIDGQLMGLQEIEEGASAPYSTNFLWSPQTTGVHALIIRALGFEGPLGFSDAVHVGIVQSSEETGPSDDMAGVDIPVVLPAAEDPGDYAPPGPGQTLLPAVQMDGAPQPGEAGSKPVAPILTAEVSECSVALNFHDLSDNEVGFNVYRQPSNSQIQHQIDTLQPGEGQGWMSYADSGVPGGATYIVAAFNGMGESASNPVLVNVDGEDCPSGEDGPPALALDLGELLADSGADRAYCYQSLGGQLWSRFPAQGFFTPGDEGQNSLISLGNLVGQDDLEPMLLSLECWGWVGGGLELLGTYEHQFDLGDGTGLSPQIDLSVFKDVLAIVDLGDSETFYPMGGDFDFGDLDLIKFDLVHEPAMPIINTYITYDPDVCKSHLMPEMQNLLGQIIFCAPYPGFDSGDEGNNPQPYLVWDMGLECGAGSGTPPCHPYGYWESLAADLGGNVWFAITDTSSAGTFHYNIDAPELFDFTIPPVACSGNRSFGLTMYYSESLTIYFSLPSNLATINCPQPLPWEIPLEVTFEDIRFWALDDGDDGADDVEVYGYFYVGVSGGMKRYINLAEWNEQGSDCPDESGWFGSLDTGGALITGGCTKTFGSSTYDLADVALCHGSSKSNCSYLGWGFDQNSVVVNVTDWDSVTISFVVYDWDDASANDLQCHGSFSLPARDRFEWAQLHNFHFETTSADMGNGGCAIEGAIEAVVP